MEAKQLLKPVNVSPFIKFGRWSFLIWGIIYGWNKWNYYRGIQVRIREEREKIRPILEAREKAASLEKTTEEMKKIAKELNIDLPPDWVATGL